MVAGAGPMPHTRQSPSGADARAVEAPRRQAARGILALQRAAGNRAVGRILQRVVHPEDVASELVGREFKLSQDVTVGGVTHKAGTSVEVRTWDNTSPTVTVIALPRGAANPTFDVPKKVVRPVDTAVAGVAPYDAGLDSVLSDFERGEQKIAAENARKDGPRADEITRLEGLQTNRLKLLNTRLIQASMLNRFDASIKKWTDHYNTKFGFTGKKALDPDLVKAMIFDETQMGTSGQHLEVPPTHPVKTRFNIGQMIDSSTMILLELIREDEPALIATYHLENIEKDLSAAQIELRDLKKVKTPDATQTARKADLETLSESYWERFMWNYRAAGQTVGLREAVDDYFDLPAGSTDRNFDYDFWVRACILELFGKRKEVSTWEEAARAYNGIGDRARKYKARVTTRMAGAKAAQKAKKPYVPGTPNL
jgi:hypothetical protein